MKKRRVFQSPLCVCGHPKIRHRLYPYNSAGRRTHDGRCEATLDHLPGPSCHCLKFRAPGDDQESGRP